MTPYAASGTTRANLKEMKMEVILKPVYVDAIVRDGQDETPFTRLIWEASFGIGPGSDLVAFGASQEAAVAALYEKRSA